MRKISVFNFVTLNGYYEGPEKGNISWHVHGGEDENEFSSKNANAGGILLFGRVTYDLMASFWPSPQAKQNFPAVAEGMNKAEKIVFSRTLKKTEWNNTRIIGENIIDEIKKMKLTSGPDMTILGSGTILTQFAENGLIDEFQFMLDPLVLGSGTPIFKGINHALKLRLTNTRIFKSGNVLLWYGLA